MLTVSSCRSLLDQLRRLQAMVIQTANKASSGSTCVLVRTVTEGDILLSAGRERRATRSPSSSLSSCFFRFCSSPSVSSSYLLCTPRTQGGACRLSTEVRASRTPLRTGWGEPQPPLIRLCLLSIVPSASGPSQRGPPAAGATCPAARGTKGQLGP